MKCEKCNHFNQHYDSCSLCQDYDLFSPKLTTCIVCNGTGKYYDDFRDEDGNWTSELDQCFECEGSGLMEEA